MSSKRGYRGSIRAGILLVLLCAGMCCGGGLTNTQKYQLQSATMIISKLGTGEISLDKQFEMVFLPIAKANEVEFERNRKIVESLLAKSRKIQRKSEKKAKEYLAAAKAYKQYAEVNLVITKAYAKKDDQALSQAIARLMQLEKQVQRITGRKPGRSWFTPEEVENLAFNNLARKKRAAERNRAVRR